MAARALTASLEITGTSLRRSEGCTLQIPLTVGQRPAQLAATQSLSFALGGNEDDAESIVQVMIKIRTSESVILDPRARVRHDALKGMATGYQTNLRNLEEPWRTLYAELLRAVLPRHVMIQEEGTLWTFHDTTQNQGVVSPPLDRTMPLARKTGYEHRTDFRAILFLSNGLIHFPILGENKAAISRQDTAISGWPDNIHGRAELVDALQRAVLQVELQAVVLFKTDSAASLPETRQSIVCLIVAVGPIYAVAFATRDEIEAGYSNVDVASAAEHLRKMRARERRDVLPLSNQPEQPPALPDAMTIELDSFEAIEFTRPSSKLPDGSWSRPVMLDTPESDTLLLGLQGWQYLVADV
ncbi:hypothetical protein DFH07DRAFT_827822 [Mycena maculata]|uniref:Pterin-binding domain-containing protein n=1 Tax=Mycena maculata TaxID=230809 RepID=A0AAD7IV70_9AGAR|nr:hypothetical protein DFH07DRAFT_827822 [Mycena maculata]